MTKRILVIDDEEGLREIIALCLEVAAGWQVWTAACGSEGIAIALAQQPDAILLDVMMPEMDGPETLRRLKANPETQRIPAIWLSAKARIAEQKEFIDLGVAGAIVKPFQADALADEVRKILNWSE